MFPLWGLNSFRINGKMWYAKLEPMGTLMWHANVTVTVHIDTTSQVQVSKTFETSTGYQA